MHVLDLTTLSPSLKLYYFQYSNLFLKISVCADFCLVHVLGKQMLCASSLPHPVCRETSVFPSCVIRYECYIITDRTVEEQKNMLFNRSVL